MTRKWKSCDRLTRQEFDDLFHFLLEANLEDPVCLIYDKTLQVVVDKTLGVLYRGGR